MRKYSILYFMVVDTFLWRHLGNFQGEIFDIFCTLLCELLCNHVLWCECILWFISVRVVGGGEGVVRSPGYVWKWWVYLRRAQPSRTVVVERGLITVTRVQCAALSTADQTLLTGHAGAKEHGKTQGVLSNKYIITSVSSYFLSGWLNEPQTH